MEFKFYKLLQYHLICKTILQHYCKIVCNQIKHVFYILMVKYLNICVGVRASALGIANAKCKENLAFQTPKYSDLELQNPSIAIFFAILLQCNSKGRIALQQYCKYIYIYLAAFPWNFSLLSLIIYVLFSLFLLSFSSTLSSLQTQTPSSSQHQHHTSQQRKR